MSEKIRVGNTTMFADTIPVKVVYDEIFNADDFPEDVIADRFQIVEIDGNYLVIQESVYEGKPSQQKFKCFLSLGDAYAYLEMFGAEIEGREQGND